MSTLYVVCSQFNPANALHIVRDGKRLVAAFSSLESALSASKGHGVESVPVPVGLYSEALRRSLANGYDGVVFGDDEARQATQEGTEG